MTSRDASDASDASDTSDAENTGKSYSSAFACSSGEVTAVQSERVIKSKAVLVRGAHRRFDAALGERAADDDGVREHLAFDPIPVKLTQRAPRNLVTLGKWNIRRKWPRAIRGMQDHPQTELADHRVASTRGRRSRIDRSRPPAGFAHPNAVTSATRAALGRCAAVARS